jgi:hypothetical protein
VTTGASATVNASTFQFNLALGGVGGHGIGGGVYSAGSFSHDAATVLTFNHASTNHDDIFP